MKHSIHELAGIDQATAKLLKANTKRARQMLDALKQIEIWAEGAMCEIWGQTGEGRRARKYLDKIGNRASKLTGHILKKSS